MALLTVCSTYVLVRVLFLILSKVERVCAAPSEKSCGSAEYEATVKSLPTTEIAYSITTQKEVQPGIQKTETKRGKIEVPAKPAPVSAAKSETPNEEIVCSNCHALIMSKPVGTQMKNKKTWVAYKCDNCQSHVVIAA